MTLPRRILIFTGIMFGLAVIVAPLAWMFSGSMGVAASTLAAAICLIGGIVGMSVAAWPNASTQVITQSLVPMMIRMGIALGACMAISLRRGPLFQSGFVYYLLLFYLLSLGPETALMLRGLKATGSD
jgi:hypothetical protein